MNIFEMSLPLHGEDMLYVSDGIAVVCDGLGGLGSNKINLNGYQRTEAYLASRFCCEAIKSYFDEKLDEYKTFISENPTEDKRSPYLSLLTNGLKEYIDINIKEKCNENGIEINEIKSLPSTIALALVYENGDFVEVTAIWAGDSRVYALMSDKGLVQLSLDDVSQKDFDANLSIGISEMSNCFSVKGDYFLNYRHYVFERQENFLIFACSDGCFDGLKNIMLMEGYLESSIFETIENDEEPYDFTIHLRENFLNGKIYNRGIIDDTSLCGVLIQKNKNVFIAQYQERYGIICDYAKIIKEWQIKIKNNELLEPTVTETNDLKINCKNEILTFCCDELIKAVDDWNKLDDSHRKFIVAILELPFFSNVKNEFLNLKHPAFIFDNEIVMAKENENDSISEKTVKINKTKNRNKFNERLVDEILNNKDLLTELLKYIPDEEICLYSNEENDCPKEKLLEEFRMRKIIMDNTYFQVEIEKKINSSIKLIEKLMKEYDISNQWTLNTVSNDLNNVIENLNEILETLSFSNIFNEITKIISLCRLDIKVMLNRTGISNYFFKNNKFILAEKNDSKENVSLYNNASNEKTLVDGIESEESEEEL